MRNKHLIATALAGSTCLTLAACSQGGTATTDNKNSAGATVQSASRTVGTIASRKSVTGRAKRSMMVPKSIFKR